MVGELDFASLATKKLSKCVNKKLNYKFMINNYYRNSSGYTMFVTIGLMLSLVSHSLTIIAILL